MILGYTNIIIGHAQCIALGHKHGHMQRLSFESFLFHHFYISIIVYL